MKKTVVIEYPDGIKVKTSFTTNKGAKEYFKLKSKGKPLSHNGNFVIPKNVYLENTPI